MKQTIKLYFCLKKDLRYVIGQVLKKENLMFRLNRDIGNRKYLKRLLRPIISIQRKYQKFLKISSVRAKIFKGVKKTLNILKVIFIEIVKKGLQPIRFLKSFYYSPFGLCIYLLMLVLLLKIFSVVVILRRLPFLSISK